MEQKVIYFELQSEHEPLPRIYMKYISEKGLAELEVTVLSIE